MYGKVPQCDVVVVFYTVLVLCYEAKFCHGIVLRCLVLVM